MYTSEPNDIREINVRVQRTIETLKRHTAIDYTVSRRIEGKHVDTERLD